MTAPKPAIELDKSHFVDVMKKFRAFQAEFTTEEQSLGKELILFEDKCSGAYYTTAHVKASTLVKAADLEAVLDPTDSEEYKLNRDIYTDNYAYQVMRDDACKGRRFEDIVMEFDGSYRPSKPLKVFGGQHRVTAIQEAIKAGQDEFQGLRVYFCLTEEQRLDVAKTNNTAIAVANDLLDRMQEDFVGTELRTWCQTVGLLEASQNFADKRNALGLPTVRIARTFITNFQLGKGKNIEQIQTPIVCQSGPEMDAHYAKVRNIINWQNQALLDAGREFVKLHKLQRERVNGRKTDSYAEYANKTIHPSIVAAWAFAAGMFQGRPAELKKHYDIPSAVATKKDADPLAAVDLSKARLKGGDPDTYRGLGARIGAGELGRMLEVFLLHATKATKVGINLKLANTAIQSYEAKKQVHAAQNAIRGI